MSKAGNLGPSLQQNGVHPPQENWFYVALLFVYALFIWRRDRVWISTSDDTLPILKAIPFVFGLVLLGDLEISPFPIHLYVGLALSMASFATWSWALTIWLMIAVALLNLVLKSKLTKLSSFLL